MSAKNREPGYFPIAVNLDGRPCLVVGGGAVALRKVRALLDYGGVVTVVAPEVGGELADLAAAGRITLFRRAYEAGEAARFGIVIAAVDDPEVNRRVSADCRAAGVLVNVVDDPAHCDFILSGTVRRGPLTVSIGTQGTAPFFARWVREQLEAKIPRHWEEMAALAEAFRRRVLADTTRDPASKNALFQRFVAVDWQNLLDRGGRDAAEAKINALLRCKEDA